jgi:hypothetical protein
MPLVILLLALALLFPALAHDDHLAADDTGAWVGRGGYKDPFSREPCCGERDCFKVDVLIKRDGYLLEDTGEIVPFWRAITNAFDSSYWRCHKFINNTKVTRCLFVPPPST